MKFSEIDAESWPELQPYLDTCLLPLSGLTGLEVPWEATDKVAAAGQWLTPLEQAFRGRTVTMPACHYGEADSARIEQLNLLIANMRSVGFRYVVLVSGQPLKPDGLSGASLIVCPGAEGEAPNEQRIAKSVADLWRKPVAAEESSK